MKQKFLKKFILLVVCATGLGLPVVFWCFSCVISQTTVSVSQPSTNNQKLWKIKNEKDRSSIFDIVEVNPTALGEIVANSIQNKMRGDFVSKLIPVRTVNTTTLPAILTHTVSPIYFGTTTHRTQSTQTTPFSVTK